MENYNNLKATLESLQTDAEKFFEKGNNAAGTRLRKGLQDLKKLASTVRKEVTEKKKAAKEAE